LLPILYGFHSRCPQVASIKNIALILDSDIFLEPFQDFGPDYPRCERLLFVCVEERKKNYLFIFWVILLHRWAGIHHPSCIQHTSSRNLLIISVLTILGEIYTYIYICCCYSFGVRDLIYKRRKNRAWSLQILWSSWPSRADEFDDFPYIYMCARWRIDFIRKWWSPSSFLSYNN
jgi:hypothetical protein